MQARHNHLVNHPKPAIEMCKSIDKFFAYLTVSLKHGIDYCAIVAFDCDSDYYATESDCLKVCESTCAISSRVTGPGCWSIITFE